MQVSQILTRQVETIGPDTTVQEAAQRMRSGDIGSLPVCDGRRLIGMVTDRDITIRITAEGRDAARTPVQEAMTPGIDSLNRLAILTRLWKLTVRNRSWSRIALAKPIWPAKVRASVIATPSVVTNRRCSA